MGARVFCENEQPRDFFLLVPFSSRNVLYFSAIIVLQEALLGKSAVVPVCCLLVIKARSLLRDLVCVLVR